ncbi:sulfate ABC transporter substrate-binding protein [Xylophilus sp. ASV27]|uniref:sulfate ABC transporter substrate-binding protein n=1 Tax=Xylophilus sp. ASV27 TaxID=2795129 RepID=UPI0018EB3C37|nr:sulfate ABC transporter substrate-binding protein [Xylophilus sp. ASV27]
MAHRRDFIKIPLAGALAAAMSLPAWAQTVTLLNVSYDPTRELYVDYNKAFAAYWKGKTGQDVVVKQSHGGSGKQARSIIDGIDADVATLALGGDIDALVANGGWVRPDWQKRLPHNSAPYTSTIVFLVKKGNPKGIRDWDDLARPGVQVITPNPKTSGGARWNYLAGWEYAKRKYGGEAGARGYIAKLFKNVPVLDTGARGATITFVQRGVGDVLLAWENEAFLALKEFGPEKFEIVVPSISILAEPSVAVVDRNVDRKGTRIVAEEYLKYLYSDEGQDIAGRNFYRPTGDKAKARYARQFPQLTLVTIDQAFGGWAKADKEHFADGGTFDQLYANRQK